MTAAEREEAILSTVLLTMGRIKLARRFIHAYSFSHPGNRMVWQMCVDLDDEGLFVSPTTLAELARARNLPLLPGFYRMVAGLAARYVKSERHAFVALLQEHATTVQFRWSDLLSLCESPIEKTLASSLSMHWHDARPALAPCTLEMMRAAEMSGHRLVFAQYPVAAFRADFLIVHPSRPPVIVECDGWAFHQGAGVEKHEQDAARDKALDAIGFCTLRFGGWRLNNEMMDVLATIERAVTGFSS